MTETVERETLWVTDAELIRRIGCPEKIARGAIRMLDRDPRSGFPRKQELWGKRRYWPAVKAYLDKTNGLGLRDDAARVAPEDRLRSRLPRQSPAEPLRRASNDRQT